MNQMQDRSTIDLHVLVITPAARSWLQSSHTCRVLHVFPAACNLVDADNSVLSLVKDQEALNPFSVLVSSSDGHNQDGIRFDKWLDIDSPTTITPGGMRIGDVNLSADHARLWNPQFTWEDIDPDKLGLSVPVIEENLSTVAPQGSLFDILRGGQFSGVRGIAQAAWREMKAGLLDGDSAVIASGARKLAGLGEGLTPAGDDFLLGLIYALWIMGNENTRQTVQDIVREATPRTTSLSATWLDAAGSGEAGIMWHWLMKAIQSASEAEVASLTLSMGQVGHTSGSDALAGFLAASMLLPDREIAKRG